MLACAQLGLLGALNLLGCATSANEMCYALKTLLSALDEPSCFCCCCGAVRIMQLLVCGHMYHRRPGFAGV